MEWEPAEMYCVVSKLYYVFINECVLDMDIDSSLRHIIVSSINSESA